MVWNPQGLCTFLEKSFWFSFNQTETNTHAQNLLYKPSQCAECSLKTALLNRINTLMHTCPTSNTTVAVVFSAA